MNTTKITIKNFIQEVQFVGNAHALPTSPQTSLPVLLQYFRKSFLKSGKLPAILPRCLEWFSLCCYVVSSWSKWEESLGMTQSLLQCAGGLQWRGFRCSRTWWRRHWWDGIHRCLPQHWGPVSQQTLVLIITSNISWRHIDTLKPTHNTTSLLQKHFKQKKCSLDFIFLQ